MPWVNIPDTDIDEESPIKESLVTALRDNVKEMFDGDAGAPKLVNAAIKVNDIDGDVINDDEILRPQIVDGSITERAISNNQIDRSLLNTTLLTLTVSQAVALPPNGQTFNLGSVIGPRMLGYFTRYNPRIGGDFYKFRMGKKRGSIFSFGTDLDLLQHAWFWVSGVAVGTSIIEINVLYMTSSPPWNLGNGDIPLFMFAMIDKDKNIKGFSACIDPPWGQNEKVFKKPDGKKFIKEFLDLDKAKKDRKYYDDFRKKLDAQETVMGDNFLEIEYTQPVKNRFKDLLPVHFGHVPEDHSVIIIDPVSDFCEDLKLLADAGENIAELFNEGQIVIKDKLQGVNTPANIEAYKADWA